MKCKEHPGMWYLNLKRQIRLGSEVGHVLGPEHVRSDSIAINAAAPAIGTP